MYTVGRGSAPIPALVDELERRLAAALEGRYELRGLLGHGGMGAVFLAAELRLDRLVAIKVLPPSLSLDHEVLTRFEREARTAARLDHPGIVPIYSVEDVDGLHFFVMKFVPGGDLGDEIAGEPMDWERARQLLWECATALGHAHRRGVIHRDVKPANIMLDPSGHVLVADFGIAKAMQAGPQMTSTGQMIGTPQYMSPEQMEGKEVDGRADQYSLGMVAWHMLAGRQPFQGGSVASLLVKQLHEYPESLAVLRPEVPDAMVGAIERAIRKNPEERFESMDAFAAALWPERAGSVTGGGGPSATRGSKASTPRPGGARRWIAVAAMVVLAAAGGWAAWSSMSGSPPGGSDGSSVLESGSGPTSGVSGTGGGGAEPSVPTEVRDEAGPETSDAADGSQASGGVEGGGVQSGGAPTAAASTTARPAETTPGPQTPPSPATGFLTVGATPDYGYVEINGVELPNPTPIFEHPLAPGTYIVSVRREGYVTVVDTVEITSGNVTRRNVVLVRN